MKKETRSTVIYFTLAIFACVALLFITNMRSTLVVTNTPTTEDVSTTTPEIVESELDKAIKEIQSRPDVQKQFYHLAKEIYLTEKRNAIAEELKNAETELESHRLESTSF